MKRPCFDAYDLCNGILIMILRFSWSIEHNYLSQNVTINGAVMEEKLNETRVLPTVNVKLPR